MRISGLVCGAVIAGFAFLCSAQVAHARPDYNKSFWEIYKKELGSQAETTKCLVCHGQDKKVRNDYGKAVGDAIGAKNEKDAGKIKAGIEKAAKEKSGTEGKTFGDLIKDGKLPGKAP